MHWCIEKCISCIGAMKIAFFKMDLLGLLEKNLNIANNALNELNFTTQWFSGLSFMNEPSKKHPSCTWTSEQLMLTSFPGVFLKYAGNESRNWYLRGFSGY